MEPTVSGEAISEKEKRTAKRLSNDRTYAMIEHAHDAFVGMDAKGIVTEWNRQAELTFGWNKSEAIGRFLEDLIMPPERRGGCSLIKRFLETGDYSLLDSRIETAVQNREGREIPVEMTLYPIENGDTVSFGSFLHDISEQKRAERIQNTQLAVTGILAEANTLSEATPRLLACLCKSLDWHFGALWLEDEESEALQCSDIWIHPDLEAQEFAAETRSFKVGKGEGYPGRVWTSERTIWSPNVTQDSAFLRASSAALAGLKSAIVFPIKLDNEVVGVLEFFNTRSLKPDEPLLQMMTDIGGRIALFIRRRQAEDRLVSFYQELEKRVKERTEELAAANSRLQHEIAERKRLYDQAQLANRIKDEFLATVSHELRTPLNVILGHSELLNRSAFSLDEAKSTMQTIYRNAKAQAQIVNDLLDVSRIITGKLQLNVAPIDLVSVIHAALDSVRFAADAKSVRINTEITPAIGPIAGDFSRLQQVLWNLLTNSIKFTPKNGSVTVKLDKAGSKVCLQVIDNGKGIDPLFMPYLFDRFRQEDASTTRRYGGLGLGLAITRHIVEAHGGTIDASSPGKGKGATFTILLPLLTIRLEPEPQSFSPEREVIDLIEENISLEGDRILVVDDEPDSRALLNLVLGRAGAVVALAASVQEAMSLFHDFKPDILISDISMPGEDGYDLIHRVRTLSKDLGGTLPAVALTAHARNEERDRVIAAGFQRHVAKPVEAPKLISTIDSLLRSTNRNSRK